LLQVDADFLALIALDFDYTTLHGAAGTAMLLEPRGKLLERLRLQRHTLHQAHALAATSLGFAADTHDAVTNRNGGSVLLPAHTGHHGLAAGGTQAALIGGIDGSGVGHGRSRESMAALSPARAGAGKSAPVLPSRIKALGQFPVYSGSFMHR